MGPRGPGLWLNVPIQGDLNVPSLPGQGQNVSVQSHPFAEASQALFLSATSFSPLAFSIFLHKAQKVREGRGSQVGKYVVPFDDCERPFIFFLCLNILAREEIVSLKRPAIAKAPEPTAAWYPPYPTKSPDSIYK